MDPKLYRDMLEYSRDRILDKPLRPNQEELAKLTDKERSTRPDLVIDTILGIPLPDKIRKRNLNTMQKAKATATVNSEKSFKKKRKHRPLFQQAINEIRKRQLLYRRQT